MKSRSSDVTRRDVTGAGDGRGWDGRVGAVDAGCAAGKARSPAGPAPLDAAPGRRLPPGHRCAQIFI